MQSTCFHCGLDNPDGVKYQCDVLGLKRDFCCAGCQAIAETLEKNNLTDFYRFRDKPSSKPSELIPQELLELEALDNQVVLDEISSLNDNYRKIELGIEGITCGACGWLIEKSLSALPQVQAISVNVTTQRALLTWQANTPLSEILKRLLDLGYRGYPFSEDSREQSFEQTNQAYIKRLLVAALGMMQVMTYALAIYIGEFQDLEKNHQQFLHWISGIIATPVVLYSARPFFASAINNLKAKQLGMNLPVSIAIIAAYSASVYSLISNHSVYYFDSVVMFTFFLLIGRFLEHRARYRSMLKQQSFSQLLPLSASRKNKDGTVKSVSLSKVNCDDLIVVNAGAVIPVDGVLLEHPAQVNEAVLTGEFLPVSKQIGDTLISGSTNNSATLVMQVTREKSKSHLQNLINLQQDAEQLKPDAVSMADNISHWYVLILLLIVIGTGIFYWYHAPLNAFPIILSVLVVSCPCALSLATPAAITAATSQLADNGLMIRSKTALSNLARITDIYFDKTGTITTGEMQLSSTEVFHETTEEQCRQLAYLLERNSNHPVSKAFECESFQDHTNIKQIKEHVGLGVSGIIGDDTYWLGSRVFLEQRSIPINVTAKNQLGTKLYLANHSRHLATFTLQDKLKGSAKETIHQLKNMNYNIALLSGDSAEAVKEITDALSIQDYHAECSPEKKLELVALSQNENHHSLMIGDGFNDVGALAAASVSITMGTGTNVSKTASDAVLVSSDLSTIANALKLAKKVQSVIKQNLSWAITYNLLAIPFAMMGLIPAWLAAIGMSLSSLVVVLNALRLRTRR